MADTDTQPRVASPPDRSQCLKPGMASEASDQSPGSGRRASAHLRFKRTRTGRACVTCHSRKVRCDAASLGIPCTNCIAFSLECTVPTKSRKNKKKRDRDNPCQQSGKPIPIMPSQDSGLRRPSPNGQSTVLSESSQAIRSAPVAKRKVEDQAEDTRYYAKFIKRRASEAPITEAGKVVYLVESSNMSLLMNDYNNSARIVHYPINGNGEMECSHFTRVDKVDLQMLRRRGALSLPPRAVSDDLIKTYFKWVAPIMPIINKTRFMEQYRNPNNPPSLLLQQAVFLAASRACGNPGLMDSSGSTIPAATIFYQRAKALYEASYEDDHIAIIQALILMGWYWEEPGKVTKSVFYWNGLAVTIAHGCGMHRNAEESRMSKVDKRLWKRIWWTLFTRDRSVAVALGRPTHINMHDSDVDMLTEEDFIEDDDRMSAHSLRGRLELQFFLQYVKLCEVMDLVLLQNYSIAARARQQNALGLTECDMALADWLQNCPQELRWDQSRHSFWPALLFSIYYTTSCLLHRTHLPATPPHFEARRETRPDYATIVLRNPAMQAAHAITLIMETFSDRNELRFTPPFVVYSLSSALLIHVYQLHIAMPATDVVTQNRIRICIACLEQIAKVWLVAKMVQNLFEFIISEKGFGDFLQYGRQKIQDNRGLLTGQRSRDLARHRNDDMEKKYSEESGKHLAPQGPALTPSLLAHMFAALKSGTSSSSLEIWDSVKYSAESDNTNNYQKPSCLTGVTNGDIYKSHFVFDTQPDSPAPYQLDKSERNQLPTQEPVDKQQHILQQTTINRHPEMNTGLQSMAVGNLSVDGQLLSRNQDPLQSAVNRSQNVSNEMGELQPSYQADEIGYHESGSNNTSFNTTIGQPPAPTGPNVLDWIQYFGIGNYRQTDGSHLSS